MQEMQNLYRRIRTYFTQPNAVLGQVAGGASNVYRLEENGIVYRCSIGCLLNDEQYEAAEKFAATGGDRTIENRAVYSLTDPTALSVNRVVCDALGLTYIPFVGPDPLSDDQASQFKQENPIRLFLQEIQAAHDGSRTVEEFIGKLDYQARKNNLTVISS